MNENKPGELLIIVPCYNEELRFDLGYWQKVVTENPSTSFIFVNDGSTDNTLNIIKAVGFNSSAISLEDNSGKSESIRQGWIHNISESKVWKGLGFIDSDGAFCPEDIQRLINTFKSKIDSNSKVDVILSSRVALAGRKIERSLTRHYLGRIVSTYLCYKWPNSPYDTQSGFKIFINTEYFTKSIQEPFKTRWFFDIELLVRLKSLKQNELIIWEEPLMSWKEIANSKISGLEFLRIAGEILRIKSMLKNSLKSFI